MGYTHNNKKYIIERYPQTDNKSLKPWSAADEHMLEYLKEQTLQDKKLVIYNDRFGFLACTLNNFAPISVINYHSQYKAHLRNFELNGFGAKESRFKYPLRDFASPIDVALIKLPKSLELFSLFLNELNKSLHTDSIVVCSFMTRNFSPQILKIAEQYFEEVEQSRAWKKSRLLILKKVRKGVKEDIINQLSFKGRPFKQYFGVFSSKNIDYASQFLIEKMEVEGVKGRVLDLASGNGVLASAVRDKNKEVELHLLDDSYLAVESSKLNLEEERICFHFADDLTSFEAGYFDRVITNPPFHFEFENNIEVSLRLFSEVHRCLKTGGQLQIVANRHVNYKTHLEKIFSLVKVAAENAKYVIYTCEK